MNNELRRLKEVYDELSEQEKQQLIDEFEITIDKLIGRINEKRILIQYLKTGKED